MKRNKHDKLCTSPTTCVSISALIFLQYAEKETKGQKLKTRRAIYRTKGGTESERKKERFLKQKGDRVGEEKERFLLIRHTTAINNCEMKTFSRAIFGFV